MQWCFFISFWKRKMNGNVRKGKNIEEKRKGTREKNTCLTSREEKGSQGWSWLLLRQEISSCGPQRCGEPCDQRNRREGRVSVHGGESEAAPCCGFGSSDAAEPLSLKNPHFSNPWFDSSKLALIFFLPHLRKTNKLKTNFFNMGRKEYKRYIIIIQHSRKVSYGRGQCR